MDWENNFFNEREERSLYSMLCLAFCEWHPSIHELASALPGVSKIVPVFKLPDGALASIAIFLQVSAEDLQHSAGMHLRPKGVGCFLRTELRYCPDCLGRCWHSSLFQHWGLARCPVHHSTLRTGCPSCKRPVGLGLLTLSTSPFACDTCGDPFIEYRDWRAELCGAQTSPFAQWHRGLSEDRSLRSSGRRCALWGADWKGGRTESLGQATRISRHIWWHEPAASIVRPRDFTVEITRRDGEPVVSIASIMVEIESMLRKCELHAPPPGTFGSTRSSLAMPVAAAAFWMTVNSFLSPHEFVMRRERAIGVSSVVGDLPFDWPQACALLLRAEVTGLMVRNLLAMSTLKYLAEVDWQAALRPELYAPAWLLEKGSTSRASLTVRPVAGSRTLAWLIERKGKRLLQRSHFDRHLGTLIDIREMYDPN